MRILFSILFAGIVVRLKPTVTALLQHPLQVFRAHAPAGDISTLKSPPSSTPVNPYASQDSGARRYGQIIICQV